MKALFLQFFGIVGLIISAIIVIWALTIFIPFTKNSSSNSYVSQNEHQSNSDDSMVFNNLCGVPKYLERFKENHSYPAYFDFQEGMDCASQLKKPVLLIFDAWGAANSRKIQKNVFRQNDVWNYITTYYVVICLYVDDKTKLTEEEWSISEIWKDQLITTIGMKNVELQTILFQTGAQPSIGILNHEGTLINEVIGYTSEADEFLDWLKDGKKAFEQLNEKTQYQ